MGRFVVLFSLLIPVCVSATLGYHDLVERWRQEREAGLKADAGWLSLAGLFWLQPGHNTVGSAAGSNIILPRGPARVGAIEYRDGKATIHFETNIHATVNGKPVTSAMLKSDAAGTEPDLVQLDDFTFFVIHRGNRDGIRLKDKQSDARKTFTGLHWYPVKDAYRIEAKWVPHAASIAVPNILGETEQERSPGYVEFSLEGRPYRLGPVTEGDELFFIFKDLTAGHETYPAGRFLKTEMPKNGKVRLDFNKAYNPPCAFTPYATCPLPPKQNRLPVRIEAGELNYGHH